MKHGDPPSLLPLNNVPEVSANVINQEKSIRGIRMGKEEVKLSLPGVKTYYNTSVIKTVRNWCTNWQIDWSKMRESPESDPKAWEVGI